MTPIDRLGAEKYVLLTTFRKSGRAVPTPVWVVRDGDTLAVWSAADTGKVKRVRRDGQVTVAPCDVRGNPRGEAVTGQATILDQTASDRIRTLIRRKYGLIGRLSLAGSRLRRGTAGSVGIRIAFPD